MYAECGEEQLTELSWPWENMSWHNVETDFLRFQLEEGENLHE